MTGTRSLFTLVRNSFGLVTGSCDRTQGNNSFVRNPPGVLNVEQFMQRDVHVWHSSKLEHKQFKYLYFGKIDKLGKVSRTTKTFFRKPQLHVSF